MAETTTQSKKEVLSGGGKILCVELYQWHYNNPQCSPQVPVDVRETGDIAGEKWTLVNELVLDHCTPEIQL